MTSPVPLPLVPDPAGQPLRISPTDVSQFVRLEQCERSTSTATINRWRRAYLRGGIDAVLVGTPGRRPARWWVGMIVRRVLTLAPADFGFARSRWTCEAVAVVLREDHGVRVSRETVRRRMRESDLVWRRPRPVVRRRSAEVATRNAGRRDGGVHGRGGGAHQPEDRVHVDVPG
jgi:transposase